MATCLRGHPLSDEEIQNIVTVAKDWALAHGVVVKPDSSPEGGTRCQCAPFTLFPSVVPRPLFQQGIDCMKDFNTLMYRVSQDHEFMDQCLNSIVKVDPFIRGLWDIYTKTRDEGIAQPISLDLYRNDFMMNVVDGSQRTEAGIPPSSALSLKQIEINTIAASFGGLIGVTTLLHRYTLDLARKDYTENEMPDNDPAMGFAAAMVKAWELYGNPDAVILFLVGDTETNVIDQRWLEFKIHQLNRKVRVMRQTLLDVNSKGQLLKDRKLFLDKTEVALIYLRSGYGEESYTSDKEWSVRLLMERSKAIKCPSVRSQLSGCKKIQQELARPGAVERFVKDPAAVKRIRDTFAGLYSLDKDSEGDAAVRLALASPDKYVLKPQREGGGHNLYGTELKKELELVGDNEKRGAYILMERIFPLPEHNYLLKPGTSPLLTETVSELGIYGSYISDGETEISNVQRGHMLRTKKIGTDEGGIAVGFAVLDTPYIVDV